MVKVPFLDLIQQYKDHKEDIDKEIKEVLDSASYVLGPKVKEFEQLFAEYCGVKYCVGLSNGTSAITLALKAIGVKNGDEVIIPANTFIATAEAVSLNDAIPVFVDVDPSTYLIDVNKIEEKINKNTKVIIPVHLYGQCAEMDSIIKIANKHRLMIIEDCAQAQGAIYKGKKAGSMGLMGCFSFYPGKNLGAFGDAGAIVTKNETIAIKIMKLRDHGSIKKYVHELIGLNERLDSIQAGVLKAKLKHLDEWNKKRRDIANKYKENLSGIGDIILPDELSHNEAIYHLFVIQTKFRDALSKYLNENEIATGLHYPIPLYSQEAYKHLNLSSNNFPVTEAYSKKLLSLPIFPEMTEAQVDFVCNKIKEFFNDKKN